jgi:hypothetical protein
MFHRPSRRVYSSVLAAALTLMAAPAFAQFQPRSLEDPATGEKYWIEASALLWRPSADVQVTSNGLGIVGTEVNFKRDLGLQDGNLPEFHVVLRPGRKHKLRLDHIPIKYSQEAYPVQTEFVFNGQKYNVGVPVNWLVDWKAYRYSYEYDFVSKDRGFGGLILEAKRTNLKTELRTPARPDADTFSIDGYLPALGGIFRVYVVPNISITGEIVGVGVPKSVEDTLSGSGYYVDYDFYGTLNFINNVGVQVGYRAMNVAVNVVGQQEGGRGSLLLRGLYFGVVARY